MSVNVLESINMSLGFVPPLLGGGARKDLRKEMKMEAGYRARTHLSGCDVHATPRKFERRFPKKNKKSANRIECEYVFPAHLFGQSLSEWRNGHPKCVKKNGKKFKGRKCAEKVHKEYGRMQADMFNLYPSIGEVNGRRNYSMAIIKGEEREFSKYDVEI